MIILCLTCQEHEFVFIPPMIHDFTKNINAFFNKKFSRNRICERIVPEQISTCLRLRFGCPVMSKISCTTTGTHRKYIMRMIQTELLLSLLPISRIHSTFPDQPLRKLSVILTKSISYVLESTFYHK